MTNPTMRETPPPAHPAELPPPVAYRDGRPHPGAILGATLWRLMVAGIAMYGYVDALNSQNPGAPLLEQLPVAGRFLSQIGTLVIAFAFAGFALYPFLTGWRRNEPRSPWLRGQLVILMLLIALPYNTIMGGPLDSTWELLEHVVIPAMVLLDWIVVGRAQGEVRWWYPVSWLAYPVVYMYAIIVYDAPNYGLFVPGSDDFGIRVLLGAGILVAVGYLLLGLGRGTVAVKRAVSPRPDPAEAEEAVAHAD